MIALTPISLCSREYQDIAFERIAKASWLEWLNDAQRNVVLVRPDANAVTAAVQLVAGTKQSLPTGGLRLLDATRNMGSTGTTPGRTLRFIERDTQDMIDRAWHKDAAAVSVREIVYAEKKDPLSYSVTPPVSASTQVWIEITYSKIPTDVTDADAGLLTISDIYAGPMQMWMLHRAFSMATQAQNQFQRAGFYFGSFFNLLGVKMKSDMFFSATAPDIFPKAAGGSP